jgi:hypothetical protein
LPAFTPGRRGYRSTLFPGARYGLRMSRAVAVGLVGLALALTACSGGGGSVTRAFGPAPACPLLAQLAETGQTVATTNISDPAVFAATMQTAVASYVRTARSLRAVVPARLRADVDTMISAAQQHRFADATGARNAIDNYAKSACKVS